MRRTALVAPATALLVAAAAARGAGAQEPAHRPGAHAERLGTVRFPTSCAPAVAPRFDRAVALLHSFEFGASTRAFEAVLAVDPGCAMAHWGIALGRWGNPMAAGRRPAAQLELGRAAAAEAARLGARATARERGYVAAVARLFEDHERVDQHARVVAYERAMGELAARHPADTEAAIFHAIALTASALPGDKSYARQLRAGRTLEAIWAAQPDHPGLAHYIIHSYDHPPLAARAARAAARYARIAPAAAHALHMPSHTFTRVGDWEGSIATNRRSIDAALGSGSIAEALHASDYVVYAHLQRRELAEARAVLDGLPALAARFDVNAVTGAAPGSAGVFALAAIPARDAIERRDWARAAALVPAPSDVPWTEAMVHFARALGASHTRDHAAARASVDSLAAIEARLLARGERYWAEQVAVQGLAARARLHRAEGRDAQALAAMREAAAREDATEKSAVSPGPLAPARELLGDLLLELGRPAEALAAYRTALRSEPNRYHALDGARRAAAAAGERAAAARYAAELRALTRR
jgi:tetratricopeptide (TPR) repeat protein